jgi:predicted CxxxxCH...CXXCH cytochrome family protein
MSMRSYRAAPRWSETLVVAGFALSVGAGCGQVESTRPDPVTGRTTSRATAAPSGCGLGAHARHDASGIACATCHPCGGQYGFTTPVTYKRGTTSAGGTVTVGTGTVPTTCSVGCHFPLGAPAHTVAWNAQGPIDCTACHDVATLPAAHPPVTASMPRSTCEVCHDTTGHTGGVIVLNGHGPTWIDKTSPGFHAYSADRGLASCKACHGPDLSGGATAPVPTNAPACGSCHDQALPPGVASWKVNCLMCHGGKDNATGAPPGALWGYAGDPARGGGTVDDVRVGAHTAHVTAGPVAGAFGCEVCHVKPADALAGNHIAEASGIPLASVVFGGRAVDPHFPSSIPAPQWDRASATCSNTYCHGATLTGGSKVKPIWSPVGQGQAACGTCHGVPPPLPHFQASGRASCSGCHSDTVNPDGTIKVAGGFHINGLVDVSGGGCTACHGDPNRVPASLSAAPPRDTAGATATTSPGVGAHQQHLAKTNFRTAPIPCTECHVVPADFQHANEPVKLAWGPIATSNGYVPTFDPATLLCTNACHQKGVPLWTGVFASTGTTLGCTSCHGMPPATVAHQFHTVKYIGITMGCNCHPNATKANGYVDRSIHIDGVKEVRTDTGIGWRSTSRTCTNMCHDTPSPVWQ